MWWHREHILSILLGFVQILIVSAVVPFITDNSSERLSLEEGSWVGTETSREVQWAETAFRHVMSLDCKNVFFTTAKECEALQTIPKSSFIVHVAPFTGSSEYIVMLPDEKLTRKDTHQGVVVLDPYPSANFGHLVVVFYVDNKRREKCLNKNGIYIDSSSDCLTFALKRRCKNAIKRNTKRKHWARRCEINFLPVVNLKHRKRSSVSDKRYNYLKCWKDLKGYGNCPDLRPEIDAKDLICNPIRDNTKRCSTTHEMVHTNCKIFEICDQAVLISGGWNRETSGVRFKHNLAAFYRMLRQYNFKKSNIKIFYANGASGLNIPGEHAHQVHPAAMKLALRYHIQTLCRSPHCVNSLVIYMNSPSKNDGSSLLWDVDKDGLASNSEVYTVKEFKEDLSHCTANYVHVVVDQSFAGQLADSFRNSPNHRNVIVFAGSKDNEYAYDDEYTRHWVTSNHTQDCTWHIHQQSKNNLKHSSPEAQEGEKGEVRTTIFGAPCNVIPPFTHRELRRDYLGCQPLPTAVWIKKLLASAKGIDFMKTSWSG
ncbi:hypothetical protein FSP39_021810 [Pinctada imbricata]|uniref:Uncharacterized protein n=1 Tax=Pinctada imbricata TaxID=66713 RepID=A0AA88YNA2_PINIB|nr:hypothetical protein FSP39_021810 [Pinctada imbricata]